MPRRNRRRDKQQKSKKAREHRKAARWAFRGVLPWWAHPSHISGNRRRHRGWEKKHR